LLKILRIGSISIIVIGVMFDSLRLRSRLYFGGSNRTVLGGVMFVNLRLFDVSAKKTACISFIPPRVQKDLFKS
jgi:hypothetical protein